MIIYEYIFLVSYIASGIPTLDVYLISNIYNWIWYIFKLNHVDFLSLFFVHNFDAWMKIELSRPKYISWGVDDDNKRMWSGRSKYYAIQT